MWLVWKSIFSTWQFKNTYQNGSWWSGEPQVWHLRQTFSYKRRIETAHQKIAWKLEKYIINWKVKCCFVLVHWWPDNSELHVIYIGYQNYYYHQIIAYQIIKNQIIVTKLYGNQILANQILGTPYKCTLRRIMYKPPSSIVNFKYSGLFSFLSQKNHHKIIPLDFCSPLCRHGTNFNYVLQKSFIAWWPITI